MVAGDLAVGGDGAQDEGSGAAARCEAVVPWAERGGLVLKVGGSSHLQTHKQDCWVCALSRMARPASGEMLKIIHK